jgi:hypothetical protein
MMSPDARGITGFYCMFFFRVRDQVSHPYKTDKITVPSFLGKRQMAKDLK